MKNIFRFIFTALFALLTSLASSNGFAVANSADANKQTPTSAVDVATSEPTAEATAQPSAEKAYCIAQLQQLPGPTDKKQVAAACEAVAHYDNCLSVEKSPIIHYERAGSDKKGKRILAISLIHGDELPAGSVTRAWMARLQSIEPRNTWRVLPIVNPDGLKAKTRYNNNKVDLNRNFPSKDWEVGALKYWESVTKKDPRRYPGLSAASEPETQCLVRHIAEFKPDFIISIHTPLGVLDFDGPAVHNPGFKPLPWVGLGNYVGSLGRYMWVDNKTPVLTIELKGNKGLGRLEEFDHLQDISGTVAIQAGRLLTTDTKTK